MKNNLVFGELNLNKSFGHCGPKEPSGRTPDEFRELGSQSVLSSSLAVGLILSKTSDLSGS